ncbi:MAG TPA: efflux RND transporter periplasmic adaptor subunit [Bacteroidales bacterium]|nr:efflux RND transporter periplasmic adaptor subunit [Bacteroidales bacterium]HPM87143.1 efflux RND transporter periplasmic adaptor subunit [Bacteroidales bacterium]HQM67986.1 efflux RND transporter periplasmic adaptor subunit [Bacteroidales bacterium]
MNKRFKSIITILLILAVAAIIFYPKLKPVFGSKNIGPAGEGMRSAGGPGLVQGRQALSVSALLLKPVRMNDPRNSIGTLKPDEEVDLSFETSGKIVSINFTEGTRVKKGDLLAKINDKPLQAQLQKLVAQRKLVEEKEFRQRTLLDKDAISQESYDQIVTELQTIDADINLVKARILETELHAPFDGSIGLRYLSEGSYTNPSTKIARLVKISPLKIEFSIPERYADEVRIGFPVSFMVDEKLYQATVYAVDPKIDLETRTIVVRALYPNRNEELKPGRFAQVTLLLSEIPEAIAIPTEALIPEMEGEMVYLYRSGKATSRKVTTGLRTESLIQITGGLNFGDTLITTGILQLRENLTVVLDTLIKN